MGKKDACAKPALRPHLSGSVYTVCTDCGGYEEDEQGRMYRAGDELFFPERTKYAKAEVQVLWTM